MSKKKDLESETVDALQNQPASETPTTQEIRVVETVQLAKPQKPAYIAKDLLTNTEVEFSQEVWQYAYKELVSVPVLNQFKAENPQANTTAKAGFRRYQFIGYKDLSAGKVLTQQEARDAIKQGTIKKPNCSSC